MKTLVVLLLGVAFVKANGEVCQPVLTYSVPPDFTNPEVSPCIYNDTNIYNGTADECDEAPGCCMYGVHCVANDTGVTSVPDDTPTVTATFFTDAGQTVAAADADETARERSLGVYPPGFPIAPKCIPPVPFPANCKITKNEPYVLHPPTNVPYCVRIPCKSIGNAPYDKSLKLCGSQAGCYFDKELHEYRQAFGPSVLPGVPVCHLAIRNKFFQQKAQEVVRKYGSWNPYFTNCLLTQFDEQIRKGPNGCELLPILDAFYVTPKMAGWSTINSYECALIDACWRPGRGCFYPVDISKVRVKSGQREIFFQKNRIVYGRPKCQAFDSSSPLNILKSYHRCLSAGCTVDSSVTSLYYNHLFSIGKGLTSENHWKFWTDVERGHVGAYNVESVIREYGPGQPSATRKPPVFTTRKPSGTPFPFPGGPGPVVGGGPVFGGGPALVFPQPTKRPSGCGFAFRGFGGRPCEPPKFALGKPNKYCPYKPFFVPRFGVLKGSFEGCCDINLCYLPKSEISKMHSGPSIYYTEWSLYTECSATCGRGEQKRYRRCISQDRKRCTERLEESKPCNQGRCPGWGPWSSYSPCPKTCFPGGIQTRTRECFPVGAFCGIESEQTKPCNTHTCPTGGFVPPSQPPKPVPEFTRPTPPPPPAENPFSDFFFPG